MASKGKTPHKSLPTLWCDFNSVGWSGEDDDECYYAFDERALARLRPRDGMRLFVYETGRDNLIMGCEVILERYAHPLTQEARWRLRAVPGTGYLGPL